MSKVTDVINRAMAALKLTKYDSDEFKVGVIRANDYFYSGDICGGLYLMGEAVTCFAASQDLENPADLSKFYVAAANEIVELRESDTLGGKFPSPANIDWHMYLFLQLFEKYDGGSDEAKETVSFSDFFRAIVLVEYSVLDDLGEWASDTIDVFTGIIQSGILNRSQLDSFRSTLESMLAVVRDDISPRANNLPNGPNPFSKTLTEELAKVLDKSSEPLALARGMVSTSIAFMVAVNYSIVDKDFFKINDAIFGIWEYYLTPSKIAERIFAFRNIRLAHELLDKELEESEKTPLEEKTEDSFEHKVHFYI